MTIYEILQISDSEHPPPAYCGNNRAPVLPNQIAENLLA
jgi:hypothetical protein